MNKVEDLKTKRLSSDVCFVVDLLRAMLHPRKDFSCNEDC